MVKNLFLIKSAFIAALLSPLMAYATSDEYPAADFQPKVLYSDSGYKHSESAPAASGGESKTKFDPEHPAAAFEPKVLYKDPNYQHKEDKIVSSSRSSSAASSTADSASVETASAEAEGSDQTMLIGIVVLAVLGFFFYRKNTDAAAPKATAPRRPAPKAPVAAEAPEGATRVERYLARKQPKTTRVAKYLQDKEKSLPSTGVAKYLAKQVVRSRQLAEEKATGVEKYLRKKKG